ncbi:MAG: translation initiation factor IF-2 [Chloroflexi bacterium]|nr:translation initiation factor IF-2 [Chloroflexota bacterium]
MSGRPGGGGRGRGGARPGGARPGGRPGGRGRGGRRPNTFNAGAGRATATIERPTTVELPPVMTVKELADILEQQPAAVIKVLFASGMMATINQEIDFDTAAIVAEELGATATQAGAAEDAVPETSASTNGLEDEDTALLQPRPPVVTIMGHVDHGKTSLLDAIRSARVAAGEAGGITQHIGAYQIEKEREGVPRKITFLDTPGHAAFTAMRARGAQVTDIVIIVVAADDGVMPQTVEAIDHARAADVPIIIAINKIDKEGANPDRVKQELTEHNVIVEEYGGDVPTVEVSAKTQQGLDDLLDTILLVSDIRVEPKANPNRMAVATVVEARTDVRRGTMCTVLIRAMFDSRGQSVKAAPPSFPVEILQLPDVPEVGDTMRAMEDERKGRELASGVARERRAQSLLPTKSVALSDFFSKVQAGEVKELNIVLKADVQGSIGAIQHSLEELGDENVKVRLIRSAVGDVTESDVTLAAASQAIVVGFNVGDDPAARRAAEATGVDVRFYTIIYKLTEEVQAALKGLLEPVYQDIVQGHAEVRAVFPAGRHKAAGCIIADGSFTRGGNVRVMRHGASVGEGRITSLRRVRDDVREVNAGTECGMTVDGFDDFAEGDIVEQYTRELVS